MGSLSPLGTISSPVAVRVPVVVIAEDPTSIAPNPEEIEPPVESVLFVSVCVSVVPTTVPEGAATVAIVPNPSVTLCAAASASSRSAFPAAVKS